MPDTITEQQSRPQPGQPADGSSTEGRTATVWWRPSTWPFKVLASLGYWASTRLIMIMMVYQSGENAHGEVQFLYQRWAHILEHGSFPVGDPTWQYPPGAAGIMLAPLAVPGGYSYMFDFIVVVLLADLIVMGSLLWYGSRPGRSLAGAWVWVLMLPLMLFVPYARYDVIVSAFAVLALLWVQARPRLGGAVAALGAMIKVWPAFAVFGAPRGRSLWQVVIGFVAAAGSLAAIAALLFRGSFSFLGEQGSRGVEYESLPGSVLLLAEHFGYRGHVEYRYGSMEVLGPGVDQIGKAMLVASVAGFCWLLLWRLRARTFSSATPADAALAALLVFITTSRVISPQYLIWVAGVGAVCLSYRNSTQRPIVGLLILATAMTSIEFPMFLHQVLQGPVGFRYLLLARNVLLLVATVWSCARLWRATVPRWRFPRRSRGAEAA